MLGRFLELSIATADIRASLDFYRRLGFSLAEAGEAWPHPYAVLTDGRLCLGLHEHEGFETSMTFVRPELLRHVDELEGLGVEFEFRRLAGDTFNEIGWREPSGQLVRLVEARTFSPTGRDARQTSLCGYFLQLMLTADHAGRAKAHWERCGFVGLDEPDAGLPHVACTSDTIDIGLYAPAPLPAPALLFEVADLDAALARIESAGVVRTPRVPEPLRRLPGVVLTAPEGTALLICGAPAA